MYRAKQARYRQSRNVINEDFGSRRKIVDERRKVLPLGSVILVKGSVKKLVLIGRGVVAIFKGEQKYFDYVACTYPEGLIGENVLYLNHEDIEEVIQKGFQDEDDFRMQKSLKEHLDGLLKIENES